MPTSRESARLAPAVEAGHSDDGIRTGQAHRAVALVAPLFRLISGLDPPMLLGENVPMAMATASPTLVGRGEQLDRLVGHLDHARAGEPRFVLVHGDAGIGKSRLITEFAHRARDQGVTVLAGGCLDLADGTLPYWPVVEALRGIIRGNAVKSRAALTTGHEELAALLPELGAVSAPLRGVGRTRLFQQFSDLLAGLSEEAPLLLIVEDLHWADGSTRDLLSFALHSLRVERLLVVGTARDEDSASPGPQRGWIAGLARDPRVELLEVPAFSRAETSRQLAGIIGREPPSEVLARIFARSEGNPLFIEELAAFNTLSGVPRHLRDLLLSRFRRVSDEAQQILRVAAVAGYHVDPELVSEVAGRSEATVITALRDAADCGLIVTVSETMRFRHVLLQEAVYESTLPVERRALHRRFAGALAAREHPSPASLAVIAHHWKSARELAPALVASIEAASAALRILAYSEVHEQLERAVDLWARVRDPEAWTGLSRLTLLERTANAAFLAGGAGRAAEICREAIALADPTRDAERAGRLHAVLANSLLHAAAPSGEAFAAYERAAELLPPGPSEDRARVLAELARAMALRGGSGAEGRAREAIALAEAAGAPGAATMAHLALGSVSLANGDIDAARAAQRLAREIGGSPRETAIAYNNEAATLEAAGRYREGLAIAHEGERFALAHGLSRNLGCFLAANAGVFLYELGRWDEVDRLVAEQLREDINEWARVWFLVLRAQVAVGRGSATARADLATGIATARHFDTPQEMAPLLVAHAEHVLSTGDPYLARRLAEKALVVSVGALLERPRAVWMRLRVEADIGSLGALGRAQVEPSLVEEALALAKSTLPSRAAYAALCAAELARVAGQATRQLWSDAAALLAAIESRHRLAYARMREAEAVLVDGGVGANEAGALLRDAYSIARELGASPLAADIEVLAQRGRMSLMPAAEEGPSQVPASRIAGYGLTVRELDVLRYLAAGRTNREIGEALFISPKTASVHVSNILAKMAVRSRVQAAGIAHRLGIVADIEAESGSTGGWRPPTAL